MEWCMKKNKGFEIPDAKCVACGHVWKPRVPHPCMCPSCHTMYWRKRKPKPKYKQKEDKVICE